MKVFYSCYLTKAVLEELLELIRKAGKEKQKNARISLNWPQAVLRFDYVEDHGEAEPEVVVEEANEGEKAEMQFIPTETQYTINQEAFDKEKKELINCMHAFFYSLLSF